MPFKTLLLVLPFTINLSAVSELCSDDIYKDSDIKIISSVLDEYYDEFSQPEKNVTECKSNSGSNKENYSLSHYYDDFL